MKKVFSQFSVSLLSHSCILPFHEGNMWHVRRSEIARQ